MALKYQSKPAFAATSASIALRASAACCLTCSSLSLSTPSKAGTADRASAPYARKLITARSRAPASGLFRKVVRTGITFSGWACISPRALRKLFGRALLFVTTSRREGTALLAAGPIPPNVAAKRSSLYELPRFSLSKATSLGSAPIAFSPNARKAIPASMFLGHEGFILKIRILWSSKNSAILVFNGESESSSISRSAGMEFVPISRTIKSTFLLFSSICKSTSGCPFEVRTYPSSHALKDLPLYRGPRGESKK